MNLMFGLLRAKSWMDLLNWPLSSWIPFAISLACLIMLIWTILQLTTRLTEDMDPAEADRQMLQTINELHREGDLTTEEFRSLKGQLVHRLAGDAAGSDLVISHDDSSKRALAESEENAESNGHFDESKATSHDEEVS